MRKKLSDEESTVGGSGVGGVAGPTEGGGASGEGKQVGEGLPSVGVELAPVEPGEEPAGTIRKLEGGGYQIKAVGAGWITCAKEKPGLRLADFYRSHHLE